MEENDTLALKKNTIQKVHKSKTMVFITIRLQKFLM